LTSGQLPFDQGQLIATGSVGQEVSVEVAYQAARQAALNALSVAAHAVGGLDRLARVVKVVGYIQSAPGFFGQPQVLNGASELLEAIFGDHGRHARSAVGCSALPLNAAVEVECIFEVAIQP
jgi:enamine deaminase RidA (YjgF/YER057c/UK114 family)